jgi:hypothetical protein
MSRPSRITHVAARWVTLASWLAVAGPGLDGLAAAQAAPPTPADVGQNAPVGVAQATPDPAAAQRIREEVERLRKEFDDLRQQYGSRLADLESRLATLEGRPTAPKADAAAQPPPETPAAPPVTPAAPGAPATPPTQAEGQVPAGAAGAGGPSGTLPVYGNTSAASKIFNPDIAVIGDFLGASGRNIVDPQPSLEMHEAEASLQAIVDPYARADFFVAFSPEGVEVEEGFITFNTLPGGLLMKVGKMRGQFGKVNAMHNHVLPWTDRPLMTRNLVGGEEGISDSGVSVSKLILNPLFFLEATGEVYRGESAVFSAPKRSNLTYVGHLRGYRDVTEGSNLDLGGSIAYGHNELGEDFSTRLIGVDATFRYRPLRRAIYRRFVARTEMTWSRREQLDGDVGAFGLYGSGEYQFARRWFSGLRWDYSERATDASLHDRGASLLLTYWPSEFSQIRGQYRRTTYAEGHTANEFLFQFLFSIGAHGAHTF